MKKINFKLPTNEEFQTIAKKEYEDNKQNLNAISYWYPKIQQYFNTPYTKIIFMPFELWDNLYKIEKCSISDEELTQWVITEICNDRSIIDHDIFIKLGSFSGKFNFDNCYIRKNEFSTIGKKLKNIVYDCLVVDCEFIPEVALRSFIETSYSRPSIYNGLKLNTEFRAFVNFDMKEVMDIINYWDYDTMINGIWDKDDLNTFKTIGKEIERDFNEKKDSLKQLLRDKLNSNFDLKGTWSVDFLWDGNTFVLIDMAIAQQSAYYEKVFPQWKERLEKFYKVK